MLSRWEIAAIVNYLTPRFGARTSPLRPTYMDFRHFRTGWKLHLFLYKLDGIRGAAALRAISVSTPMRMLVALTAVVTNSALAALPEDVIAS